VRHPIREDIRVGVPITLEPGPHLISPIQLQVFSDRASQDLHLSGGKRRPLEAHSTRVLWEFIGGSSPAVTVEGARRPLQTACTTA
jgi:hypothetical protein